MLKELKTPSKGNLRACVEERPIVSNSAPGVQQLRKKSAIAAATPPPDWCWDHRNDGMWHNRYEACYYNDGTFTVTDQTGKVVGGMTYIVLHYVYVSEFFPTYEQNILISPTSNAWGAAVGTTVNGALTCTGGTCTGLQNDFPMQPLNVTSHFADGQGVFGTTVSTVGSTGFPTHRLDYWFHGPQFGQSINGWSSWQRVRCDNAVPGVNNVRCINYRYTPTMTYSLTGPYPELARHIQDALNSGLPGAVGGTPLKRETDSAKVDANGRRACPSPGYTRPQGKSCDEYPFRSTQQGASTANPQGPARTFTWCSIPEPTGVTGPIGYSVCMIDSTQNSTGGSILNSQFYLPYRVIQNDPFTVSITP
ncbi:hypothetical protein [Actinomadura sp. HBU206391]|uniref:NucA/NucB deoxyribonuclease domain-containing protein n=1 Tax=Actinomadura sp. HBU206391 TaxID=2731692 RepID=UPI00164FE124|nr:hypothetical protein [Actinomadura sp. HBU206391]MBC6462270.1 hypothetical protein [Actinomadura sp. HBU206391]